MTPLEITLWHEKTFPNTNLEGQLAKLEEEKLEFMEAYRDIGMSLKELVDVYIVGCGLARWSIKESLDAFNFVNAFLFRYNIDEFEQAVADKMVLNHKRKWYELPNGSSRHEGDE